MSYKVSLYFDTELAVNPKFYMSRAQAIHGMRKLAYDKLEAFGKLDTDAAHDVMSAIDACDDIIPPQAQRNVVIGNTGYDLILTNTKRYNT
jgi:hypothetical protein